MELKTENFMKIKLVEANLDGKSLVITGDNGQGKSSLINSLFSALQGLSISKPIRNGEENADIEIKIGDKENGVKFIVHQRFTEKGQRLEVYSPTEEGRAMYASPRKFLEQFINYISIDPGDLAKMLRSQKSQDQRDAREMLLNLVSGGKNYDYGEKTLADVLESYDRKYEQKKSVRSDRAVIIRSKEIEAEQFNQFNFVEGEKIDVAEKVKELNNVEYERKQYESYIEEVRLIEKNIEIWESKIESLEAQLKDAKLNLNHMIETLEVTNDTMPKIDEFVIDGTREARIKEEISNAKEHNEKIDKRERYKDLCSEIAEIKAEQSKTLQDMKKIEKAKQDTLSNVHFPIDGLSVSEDGVTFQGIPTTQISESELLRVSTAILIAQKPKLKTIIIKDGNAFTKKNLDSIIKEVEGKGYQIITEKCDDSGEIGIFIEEGEVK